MRLSSAVVGIGVVACSAHAPLVPVPDLPRAATALPPTPLPPPRPSASSATAPAPAPLPSSTATSAAVPVSLGDIGGSEELRLLEASASGAWVVLCAAGKAHPSLVIGSGSGEPIDELLAADPHGRFVVVSQAGATQLIDTTTGSRVNLSELGADVRRVRADYAEHRSLSFDPSGRALAYLRRVGALPSIVVRDLESGEERRVPPGPGDVFRLKLSADSRYVVFDALREDSNKNGRLDWPVPEETPTSACERPKLPRFRSFAYQGRGDQPTRAVASLSDGSVRDVPGLVTPLGNGLLVRESDGSLSVDHGGKRSPLAAAACSGRVLFADAERELALVACVPPPPKVEKRKVAPPPSGKRNVWLLGGGVARDLGSELYETSIDREAVVGARLVPLYPGSEAALVDLDRRELLPLPPGSRVLSTRGPLALIWRGSELSSYDARTKSERPLAHGVLKNPDLLQTGGTVLLSPFVVTDIDGPARTAPHAPLALTATGFVLTASETAEPAVPGANGTIRGPLHWVEAEARP